jgi:hypothetical protein
LARIYKLGCPRFAEGHDLWELRLMASRRIHPVELRERTVKTVFELHAETGIRGDRLSGWVSGSASIPRLSIIGCRNRRLIPGKAGDHD